MLFKMYNLLNVFIALQAGFSGFFYIGVREGVLVVSVMWLRLVDQHRKHINSENNRRKSALKSFTRV